MLHSGRYSFVIYLKNTITLIKSIFFFFVCNESAALRGFRPVQSEVTFDEAVNDLLVVPPE